ncbi:right-handed parallel beta-helix repeat-containing protein [Glacieibacterium frigidum]|nr:right-handed parallel beta-helix repeat-containing protein [Glacieibacterium frigidum]
MIGIAAALVTATPATLNRDLAAARGGDVVRLAPGKYSDLVVQNKRWSPAVTIDAREADVTTVKIYSSDGIKLVGGVLRPLPSGPLWQPAVLVMKSQNIDFQDSIFAGTERSGRGLMVRESTNVSVSGATFQYLHTGVQFLDSTGGGVSQSRFKLMRSDGINIAASHKITVDRIECSDFAPVEPDHPDCVQLWSIKGKPPTSDIVIKDSKAIGAMQGFTGFNPNDGGYDRITVTGNLVRSSYPQGIALYKARDSLISGNEVDTLPGSKWRTRIRADPETRVSKNREGAHK